MTLKEMRDAVAVIIDDDSFDDDSIDAYINQTLQEVAIEAELPDLKRVDVVATVEDQKYVSLSTVEGGFSGRLTKVGNADIVIYPSVEHMLVDYPDLDETDQAVAAVALEGSTLWYMPYPTSSDYVENIRIVYFKDPPVITDSADCTCIPSGLHYAVLVRGAAKLIFDVIEDGNEGEKTNTNAQAWHFDAPKNPRSGMNLLRNWLARVKKHYISSTWVN